MADTRDLWWAAGQMALTVAEGDDWRNRRWTESVRRSATLLEPVWPKTYSSGTFTFALPTIALLLYAKPLVDDPKGVPVEDILTALTPRLADRSVPSLEDTVRDSLIKHRHDLDDDSRLSSLVQQLTTYRPPLAYTSTGLELTSADHWPGGTLMGAAAEWVHHVFTHHYLHRSSA
ncbi:hypothetical protein JK364_23310 [Streptomyces sp. 110]|uniref:Uncharacterized protein n=1 Tax=Streptomyces endocoffeicus TaxID=2898945 RepID=A0ABS1PSA6_9ACTN|nr:hypothetical protein [Streptomyces endocoffeicus]MBL1115302.1 hypothetical protein [Streptomyces endocoffeicus]